MSKYLSIESIKNDIAFLRENGCTSLDLREIEERMEYAVPAAEVAEVVRCRECVYSSEPSQMTKLYGEPGTLTCHHGPCNRRNVNENDYCSYGEKEKYD